MEQAVIVHLHLRNRGFGSFEEREGIVALEERLTTAIEEADVGEFDGDEFGGGECVLYMYGPNADSLFDIIHRLLKTSPLASKGYAIKRYGEASSDAPEVRITW